MSTKDSLYNFLTLPVLQVISREQIENSIPHRDPFLLVDEVRVLEDAKKYMGVHYVRPDEYYFKGHFPGSPVMPGVLIVEALAQVGAVAVLIKEENKGKLAFFAGIDKCRFKKQVRPGDQLRLEVELTRVRGPVGKGIGKATVNGELACEAEITFALGDQQSQ